MDIEWFTFSDRGVYADGRHFCLGYLNIFHRNEYLRVHKLISLDQYLYLLTILNCLKETFIGLSERRPEPQQRHHVEEGASACD